MEWHHLENPGLRERMVLKWLT